MDWVLLIPLAVVLFWAWQLCAWTLAFGRWQRMGGPKPVFMGNVTLSLAELLLDLGHVVRAVLPFLAAGAFLIWTIASVAVLARDIGWIGAVVAGIVVYLGVTMPACLVLERLGGLQRWERRREVLGELQRCERQKVIPD